MELLKVDTLQQARDKLLQHTGWLQPETERIPLFRATGRVLAEDVRTEISVPDFRKSTVDGYAVRAKDTQGAGDSIPCFLTVRGEVRIGHHADLAVGPGECVYVPTGGMIPDGADAMVMVEYTESFDETQVAVYTAVASGQNVIQIGEDVREGDLILNRGRRLRPQEVGVLAAVGAVDVPAFAEPRITIISTGDELVPAGKPRRPGQIYDINTWGICGICREQGIRVQQSIALEDDEDLLRNTIEEAMKSSDIVCISGGSSQGRKDFTASVIDGLSAPGVFTHGLALKPGKPTILGTDETTKTLLVGLPGHPVAAMVVFDLLVVWLLRQRMGVPERKKLRARMEVNVAGGNGRAVCQLVRLTDQDGEIYGAQPVLGKSGLITTLSHADGYVMIDAGKEGLKKGEAVEVTPL